MLHKIVDVTVAVVSAPVKLVFGVTATSLTVAGEYVTHAQTFIQDLLDSVTK